MKTLFITVLYLLAHAATLSAQGGSDFILIKSGEQLAGEVFQPINQLREVHFKPTGSDKFQTYSAGDLKGYQFEQQFYTACNIPAEGGSVFLLTLVNGAANLYSMRTKNTFYIEKDGVYHLLERNDRMVDGKQMEDRRHKGVLKALFADCSLPERVFEHLRLSTESLSKATQQYNTCRDPQMVYQQVEKIINPVKIGLAGGAAYSKTVPNEEYSEFTSDKKGYTGGYAASIDLTLSHSIAPGFYLRPGIGIAKKHGGFTETFSQDIATTTLKLSFLQIPVRVGYAFEGKKLSPFLSAGYVYSWAIEKEQLYERTYIQSGEVVESENIELPKTREDGFIGELGVEFKLSKKWRPFLVYQIDKTVADFTDGSKKFTTHKAMLGVRF